MPFQLVKQLEQKRGDLHAVIPQLVAKHGQVEAARQLGISAATISKWLKRHGYRRQVVYVREEMGEAS